MKKAVFVIIALLALVGYADLIFNNGLLESITIIEFIP